ncbi:unnamed protein product [Urochloa humidicola]
MTNGSAEAPRVYSSFSALPLQSPRLESSVALPPSPDGTRRTLPLFTAAPSSLTPSFPPPRPPLVQLAAQSEVRLDLNIFRRSPHSPPPSTPRSLPNKTPFGATVHSPSLVAAPPPDETMSYRLVDPAPFMPPGAQRLMIPNRKVMTRAVIGGLRGRNGDLAIATIEPLPDGEITLDSVKDVLDDFLRNRQGLHYRTIQECPFGQAFVRFNHFHERDFMIQNSPHVYGNMRISFVEHNKAWNNKAISMNYEVWLMLLGYNNDFWEERDIEKALADFGKLLAWEEDPENLARIIVKARVVDLTEIPWFIVCTDGDRFEGESWTCQCEVLQATMLGGAPGDEEQPPGPDDFQPNLFHFFGYGQPGQGPPQNGPGNQTQGNNAANPSHGNQAPNQQGNVAGGAHAQGLWGQWQNNNVNLAEQHLGDQGPVNVNAEEFIGPMPLDEPQVAGIGNGNGNPQNGLLEPVLQELPPQAQNGIGKVDLNIPMEEDQGDDEELDEIIQVDEMVAQNALHQEANIIEGDTSSDSEQHQPFLPDLNQAIDVHVFIPMENGAPLQVMPDEIQEEELPLNPILQDNGSPDNPLGPLNQEMQLGFVQLVQPHSDPILAERQLQPLINPYSSPFKHNAEAARAWAKFLAPDLGPESIAVPQNWADFFTAMLMHPGSFLWAKSFLSCQALQALRHHNEGVIHFSIPDKCPSTSTLPCLEKLPTEVNLEEIVQEKSPSKAPLSDTPSPCTPPEKRGIRISPSTGPWSQALLDQAGAAKAQVMVDSDVRRSIRKKNQLKGFKGHTCMNKNCLGCSKEPPILSPIVIKNLGTTFCKMDEAKLTKEALSKKRKVTVPAPGGKKLPIPKTNKKEDNDDQKAKKSQKKQPKN